MANRSATSVEIINAGANRGARENVAALAALSRDSERIAPLAVYVDPMPGRARTLAAIAQERGLQSRAVEGTVEDLVERSSIGNRSPLILHLDRPRAIAEVLRAPGVSERPILAYGLIRLPGAKLWGVRIALLPSDRRGRDETLHFFEALSSLAERGGSDRVVGQRAEPAHRVIEPMLRAWMREHAAACLTKLIAGLEPEVDPVEITTDGERTRPLLVWDAPVWSDPAALARAVVANPSTPISRGRDFVIAETCRDEIRFHEVRIRQTDGQVQVRGVESFDAGALAELRAEDKEAERERVRVVAEAALRLAERLTISRRAPILMTD
ncbi:MAG: hypothetical protein IT379_14725 [Deltaproteobacteria bacterium]|nr:hypothetical protein [Deltaproteobacteria bacterium]